MPTNGSAPMRHPRVRVTSLKYVGLEKPKKRARARIKAFENARQELYQICTTSSDCVDHYLVSAPLRTECKKEDGGYKCYRMVEFTIGELKTN